MVWGGDRDSLASVWCRLEREKKILSLGAVGAEAPVSRLWGGKPAYRAVHLTGGRWLPCSLHPADSGEAWVWWGFCVGLERPFSRTHSCPTVRKLGETSSFTLRFQGTVKVS